MNLAMTSIHATTSPLQSKGSSGAGGAAPLAASAAIGAGVVACVLFTAREEPLPSIGWAAAILFFFVQQDTWRLRIPNWLTLPGLAFALGLGFASGGAGGLASALAGAGAALALTFAPFAVRWLGAGDVKACMVLGALWGGAEFLGVFWWMLVVGGLLAIGLVAARGGLADLLRRWVASLQLSVLTRRPTYVAAGAGSARSPGLPFAVAMGLGAAAFQLWGVPW